MLQAIIDWFKALFSNAPAAPGVILRSATEAARMKVEAIQTMKANASGVISCPFQNEIGASCVYDVKSFHCNDCNRSGGIQTLINRLGDPGVYQATIQ